MKTQNKILWGLAFTATSIWGWKHYDVSQKLSRGVDNLHLMQATNPDSKTYQMLAADTMNGQFYAQLLDHEKDTVYFSAPIVGMTSNMGPGTKLGNDKRTEYRLKYTGDEFKMEVQEAATSRLVEGNVFDQQVTHLFQINRSMMTPENDEKFCNLFLKTNNRDRMAIYIEEPDFSNSKPTAFKL